MKADSLSCQPSYKRKGNQCVLFQQDFLRFHVITVDVAQDIDARGQLFIIPRFQLLNAFGKVGE